VIALRLGASGPPFVVTAPPPAVEAPPPTVAAAAPEALALPEGTEGPTAADAREESAVPSVEMVDLAFVPAELTIPADTDVTLVLPNTGAATHDFTIDALDVHVVARSGETATVTINAPAGSYEYYCSIPGHKQGGMVGTLVVR
jgi:plastocyanin